MTATPAAHIENTANPVGRSVFDKTRRSNRTRGGANGGFDTGDMKHRVDTAKLRRETELHCDWVNDLSDTERSYETVR